MTDLSLRQFQYDLPDEQIARFPLAQRDQSRLLVYQQGVITHRQFFHLPDLLPEDTLLLFNNTKVIPARLRFQKPTGASIELFLLDPMPLFDQKVGSANPRLIMEAMQDRGRSSWKCLVGNQKRWRVGEELCQQFSINGIDATLIARWENRRQSQISFEWTPSQEPFAAVLYEIGRMPLPPYLKREAIEADKQTYQTVYSTMEGAVAAPTAGLHLTSEVFDQLAKKGIQTDYLTLHVGAGTFQPIKTDDVRQHLMHSEQVIYTEENLCRLLIHQGPIIPVGTTSLRSLESLYWFGVRLIKREKDPFILDQHYPYSFLLDQALPTSYEAVEAVLNHLQQTNQSQLVTQTGIYMVPGYQFRLGTGLVTNFHQPGSTLVVLVAALVGSGWQRIYREALEQGYRFLSYGDSSLLIP